MARTNEKVSVKYRMTGDNVLIKITRVEMVRGLFMPEASLQGQQFIVKEVGPDVKSVSSGDVVFIKGTPGKDVGLLPNDGTLMVCKEENILVIMEPVVEEE